jgi:serine/threonine protein kinase
LSPDTEIGYNVETAWEREAEALQQISELRHKHLIRLIAAFKRGTEHFFMFEWADGGSLREVWSRESTQRKDLDGDRIMCLLEQLVGLAGALSKLHNTNSETKTGKITAAAKGLPTGSKISSDTKSGTISSPTAGNNSTRSHRAPLIRVQRDSSDDDWYTSDDIIDNNEEHWRHGDLKPDNILQFKGSTWLGTLKIADLGLAKRHFFPTLGRNERTNEKYTTLQYEAPEVITNFDLMVGRSRRYDIWSMGCIILEFVIFLLYGYEGLMIFYDETYHIDKLSETLYFTANKKERTAVVSDIATAWMEQILHNDPECNSSPSGSAIKDLIELVQNRLLVVALPKQGMSKEDLKECRADADELEKALDAIWKKALHDEERRGSYSFTGSSRADVKVPQPLKGGQSMSLLSANNSQYRPSGGAKRNLVNFILGKRLRITQLIFTLGGTSWKNPLTRNLI